MNELREQIWSSLPKDDAVLMKDLEQLLTASVQENPYSGDGQFAARIAQLPVGLRAMAATHWLDISLTLDSMTWHFGNFGEPGLVEATEAGLRELGLPELANCFREAKELMLPLLLRRTEDDGDSHEMLEAAGLTECSDAINRQAWAMADLGPGKSLIYQAWLRYARQHPERVFSDRGEQAI